MIERVALRVAGGWNNIRLEFRCKAQRDRLKDCAAELVDQTLLVAPGEGVVHDGWEAARASSLWPYAIHIACSRTNATPRFGVVELEGTFDQDMLQVNLPPLHKLPWPMFKGARTEEELLRTAGERLLWAQTKGFVGCKREALSYLRGILPPQHKTRLDPLQWQSVVDALAFPD